VPLLDFFLDFLFPKRCLSCGKFGQYICDSCTSIIQIIEVNICSICEKPAIGGQTHPHCQNRYTLDGLTSFFSYQGVIRKAIKTIKYKPFAFDISKALVNLALKRMSQEESLFIFFNQLLKTKPVVVPVPLYPLRERQRGFNQSEVLGKIFSEHWDLKFIPHLLKRIKKTQPQYGLDRQERKKNIKDAFSINSQFLPAGRHGAILNWKIILIDDVWTTGTTMRTCANVLKRAGAKFVWGLTMAR